MQVIHTGFSNDYAIGRPETQNLLEVGQDRLQERDVAVERILRQRLQPS